MGNNSIKQYPFKRKYFYYNFWSFIKNENNIRQWNWKLGKWNAEKRKLKIVC